MHKKQEEIFRGKDIFWRSKMRVLKIFVGTFSLTPLVGRRGKNNAKKMLFRQEKISLLHVPRALSGTSFLFLTDPHIGGNIDRMTGEVAHGIARLLKGRKKEKTFILHG